ncbi:MAG TPA: choice-of-anchor Q domain-containing protein [Rudaea sp.]|nr:choice-of-anchor Q domain-containing protein [Rudaea sp.]
MTTCADSLVFPACDGQDDGTLRRSYFCAQNDDTIDLTQLQCSVITLSGALTDGAAYVTLQGPGSDQLKVDGANKGRVLVHNGNGELRVNGLTISNGHLDNPYAYGGGGCIYSYGGVALQSSVVTSCATATTGSNVARGGAIHANKNVSLFESTVSGSSVHSTHGSSAGGGIFARSVTIEGTTVDGNTASSTESYALGGGIYAKAGVIGTYSTISGNTASQGAGAFANAVTIVNSTVTGNDAFAVGGLYARTSASLYNSTIARNTSAISAAGVVVAAPTGIRMESVILALNKADGIEFDLATPGAATVTGSNNLIMVHAAVTTVPADTISDDPKLGPLANNGGPTQTLVLLPGSPAIDHGNVVRPVTFDQRFFERVVGPGPDIGAFEFVDSIFVDGFNPGSVIGRE